MIKKYGIKGTEKDGIFFSENAPTSFRILKYIKVEISGQNSNLIDIKREMAIKAKEVGANSIINFQYGQRSHKWWELLFTFKWDTEFWYGEGKAVKF